MGRKATPTHLKLLSGNPGHRKINHDEPEISDNLKSSDCPKDLNTATKKIWKSTLEKCPKGMIKSVDAAEFKRWCVACDLYNRAVHEVEVNGMVIISPDKGFPIQSPWVAIMNKQGEVMASAGSNLGFSPSSRTKIKMPDKKQSKNMFAVLDGGRD